MTDAAVLVDSFNLDLRLRYADAVQRRKDLRFDVARRIGGDLGGLVDNTYLRRGFAEILIMSGPDFLARGAELGRRVPWRGVILSGVDAAVAADLAASPLLARPAVLDLSGNRLGDAGLPCLGFADNRIPVTPVPVRASLIALGQSSGISVRSRTSSVTSVNGTSAA